jgi:hypothetical protein
MPPEHQAATNHIFKRVRKVSESDYHVRHVCRSVRPRGTRLLLDGFPLNFIMEMSYENVSQKLQSGYNLTKLTGTLHE